MRKLLVGLLLAAAWSGVALAGDELPVIEHAGYGFCAGEASDALAVGRLVMVFNRSRADIEGDNSMPPYFRGLAADFFQDQAAGRAPTYAHFALHRFRDCLRVQKVPLEVGDTEAFVCLTRLDIPYFFFVLKRSGESLASTTARVKAGLANWHFPEGMVEVTAEAAWGLRDERELRDMQTFLLSSCLLPAEQVSHYYGISPPAGEGQEGEAATVPGAAAARPTPAQPRGGQK